MHKNTIKKRTKYLLAGMVGLATFFVPLQQNHQGQVVHNGPVVYAATGSQTTTSDVDSQKEFADTLEVILKVIYIFMWPLLMLAGLALDNGLVYGSYFQLDSALFTFWNIVKNFANFAL